MINFLVRGSGPFPFDQLRYDEAYPADTESAIAIDAGELGRYGGTTRTIELKGKKFTAGRWASFGWEVLTCDHNNAIRSNGFPRKCCS